MYASEYIRFAWNVFKNNLGKVYLIVIPLFAASILNSFISASFEGSLLIMLVSFLCTYYVSMVAVRALILLTRAGNYTWAESLLSLAQTLRIIAIFLLSMIFFGLVFVLLFILGGALGIGAALLNPSFSLVIGLMVLAIALILVISYVVMRLQFAYYLVADYKEIGIFDALRLAWIKTEGKFIYICAVYFWGTLVMIGGMLALFVGLIVAIPVFYIILTKLYIELFDENVGIETAEPVGASFDQSQQASTVSSNTEVQNG